MSFNVRCFIALIEVYTTVAIKVKNITDISFERTIEIATNKIGWAGIRQLVLTWVTLYTTQVTVTSIYRGAIFIIFSVLRSDVSPT